MPAQLRVLRRRIRSVQSTKKITRAMELISASRIAKAQQRLSAAQPYTRELVRALEAAAANGSTRHPLTRPAENLRRSAILVLTSDRGLAGGYSSNALRRAEELASLLRDEGKEVVTYVVGRKGAGYYRFRGRDVAGEWAGFTEQPSLSDATEVADAVIDRFLQDSAEGGVDEIHIVYTQFVNMVSQNARALRILPLVVQDSRAESVAQALDVDRERGERGEGPVAQYEFEPSAEAVLDALLPRYVGNLIYNSMLQSAASEHAARRRAMQSATDNAEELIQSYTREVNTARQAAITQEISEIVGGANALSGASAGRE